jgi:hypothetical protein
MAGYVMHPRERTVSQPQPPTHVRIGKLLPRDESRTADESRAAQGDPTRHRAQPRPTATVIPQRLAYFQAKFHPQRKHRLGAN